MLNQSIHRSQVSHAAESKAGVQAQSWQRDEHSLCSCVVRCPTPTSIHNYRSQRWLRQQQRHNCSSIKPAVYTLLLCVVHEQLQRQVAAEQAQLQARLQGAPQQLHTAGFCVCASSLLSVQLRCWEVERQLAILLDLQCNKTNLALVRFCVHRWMMVTAA
jgi:hypothetical protein